MRKSSPRKQQHQISNLLTSKAPPLHLLTFGLGLAIGIIASSYLKTISFTIQATQVSFRLNNLASSPPPPPSLPPTSRGGLKNYVSPDFVLHDMTDDELRWRASMVPKLGGYDYRRVPKVAFMFLTRGELPFAPFWEKFFKGHLELYSIYIHTDPSYNGSYPVDSVFHGRRIPSKVVEWGELNMLEAERRLLANALLDFSNERFILLSEACIPLTNFPTLYSYVINSTTSFVESYDHPDWAARGRYNPRLAPLVNVTQWRKGSQWFEMDRRLALEVTSDVKYFHAFSRHCRPSCYVDEHYIPTLVTMLGLKRGKPVANADRSLTWVDWSRGGPHPARLVRTQVTMELLEQMRRGGSNGTCLYNGRETKLCFLFARKFLPNSLDRLMRFSKKAMGF